MAKPKLALIQAAQGSDKLFSVLPSSGVGDFDFIRPSSATRINSKGLIEEVATKESRLNYPLIDGKVVGCPHHILEPERRNLVTYSEDFSQGYWTKLNSSITSNSVISPDGSLNASSFTQSGGTAEHSIYHSLPTITSGAKYTGSVFLKYDDWQYFQVRFRSGGFGGEIGVIYDAINKTITTTNGNLLSSKVEDYANDWVRIYIVAQSTSANNFAGLVVAYNNSGTVFNDPDSVPNTGANAYIWGVQVEQGSYPTSYIPNNGESDGVTRAAETANGSGSAATFNDSEGVLMAEISALPQTSRIALNDGTTSNNVRFVYDAGANRIDGIVFNGSNQFASQYTLPIQGSFNKISLKYKPNDFALWVNGFKVGSLIGSGSTFTEGTLSELDFDAGSNWLLPFYGSTKQIQYYNSALTDIELEQLTSWTSFTDMAQGQQYSIK